MSNSATSLSYEDLTSEEIKRINDAYNDALKSASEDFKFDLKNAQYYATLTSLKEFLVIRKERIAK